MKVGIIGAGAWGTTIAIHLAKLGHDVQLWAHEEKEVALMSGARENVSFLPGHKFPDTLSATGEIDPAWELMVNGVPTQYIRSVYEKLGALPKVTLVSLSKGIEIGTGLLPTQVLAQVLGPEHPTAVLTGPCIAKEVVVGQPTAVVVAGAEAEKLQTLFSSDRFRVYTSDDKVGVELGGALKNVMGIAAGLVDGLGLGDNAKAALLTRGIVEIGRLGVALGAKPHTFNGLAGFGDLFTTCVSPHGRNRTLGERLGRGESLDAILKSVTSVAEGVPTTKAVLQQSREKGVEMPITEALFGILFEGIDPSVSLTKLMTRAARPEHR